MHIAVPAKISDGVATVSISNTAWDPRSGILRALFDPTSTPQTDDVQVDDSKVAVALDTWFQEGSGAGNIGDLYDNRDRGHSALPRPTFPQLSRSAYAAEAIAAGADQAMTWPVIFNLVTIGNASLAVTTGPLWRSLPRLMLTSPRGPETLFLQYASNQIYVFPEHRDHDADFGDLLTANTPYYIIAQGSSGSDQPFLFAIASILAAFRPEVKTFLKERGLIAPTVQWILRRCQRGVNSDADYLAANTHPTVFESERLDLEAMIERAHDLQVNAVPPMVRIKVLEENTGRPGVDWFDPRSETLFNTPSAVARVIRSTAHERRLVVDAGATQDPNGLPLTFQWRVIGGDGRVNVTPLNEAGTLAKIVVPWQARRPAGAWPIISSDRVDIAVFAYNGSNWSAPGFVSLLFPGNQKRVYRSDGKVSEVDYNAPEFQDRYVDPLLFPKQAWRDLYLYGDHDELLGWERGNGTHWVRFTRDGASVLQTDAEGRPTKAEFVRYEIVRHADGSTEITQVPTGTFVEYTYEGNDDRQGRAVSVVPATNGVRQGQSEW